MRSATIDGVLYLEVEGAPPADLSAPPGTLAVDRLHGQLYRRFDRSLGLQGGCNPGLVAGALGAPGAPPDKSDLEAELLALHREEEALTAAGGEPGDPPAFDYSENVLEKVAAKSGQPAEAILKKAAADHDWNKNKYLNKKELEAAAKALSER